MLAIEINNLSKSYGQTKAVKNLSLNIEKGDFFALLGPNGAGKSTTISVITSLIKKDSGLVKVLDFDIDTHLLEVKTLIGVVPQEFNFSIFETCQEILINQAGYFGINAGQAKQRADKYLNLLGIAEKAQSKSGTLSGGMKRRLMIARAMMHEPEILILDEPTAGVDVEVRYHIYKFLQDMNVMEQKTIILTTHYFEEVEQLCKNIAIIHKGEILLHDNLAKILKSHQQAEYILQSDAFAKQQITFENFNIIYDNQNNLICKLKLDQTIDQLILLLRQNNITLNSIKIKENKLENIFLSLIKDK